MLLVAEASLAAVHYDLKNKNQILRLPGNAKVHPAVANWNTGGLASVRTRKAACLSSLSIRDDIFRK
jgi:hypothetical protein